MATQTLRRSAVAARPTARPSAAEGSTIADVYEAHFRYVWRCLRSLGVRDDLLEDAAHDVFVVVQLKLHQFDNGAQLTTWLYEIALRVARRYRERAAKDARRLVATPPRSSDDSSADLLASFATADDLQVDLERGEQLELARRALESLDEEKREAFVLACVEQMSAPVIARITGLPLNTVYSRIRAARFAFTAHVMRLQSAIRRRPR